MQRCFLEISRDKRLNESPPLFSPPSPSAERESSWERALFSFDSSRSSVSVVIVSATPTEEEFFQLCSTITTSPQKLAILCISHSHLSNNKLKELLSYLTPCTSLQALDLGFNLIQDDGGQDLAAFISAHPLIVQCNVIGNAALSAETIHSIQMAVIKNIGSLPPLSSFLPISTLSAPPIQRRRTNNSQPNTSEIKSPRSIAAQALVATPPAASSAMLDCIAQEERTGVALNLLPSPVLSDPLIDSPSAPSSFEYSELLNMVLSAEQL